MGAFEEAAAARDIPITVIRDTYEDDRQKYEAKLILLRPDNYVVWKGDEVPGNLDALMNKFVGLH